MFVEYDFIVYIEPCQVNTYTDTKKVIEIKYHIGDPELKEG